VKVIVAGDRMTIDLSDVSPQVQGYFNSGATAGRSAAQVAFKCVTTPTQYPINDGAFRNLDIILPPGRVVSATKPAAMRWWMTIPMTVVDTIFRALAPAIPDRVAAGHHADLCVGTMYGINPRTGRFYVGSTNPPGGGWGATAGSDGMSAVVCINDGDTHNAVLEALEAKNPIVIERYALRPDSGGPGKRRGGLGLELRVRAAAPMRTNVHVERTKCAPWGLNGGAEALPNRVHLERVGGETFSNGNGKLEGEPLKPGDVLVIESGGGGGYGNPNERSRATVADDVRNGYVTREAALRDYGMTEAELP
jgi:N-methylhydantoinase B